MVSWTTFDDNITVCYDVNENLPDRTTRSLTFRLNAPNVVLRVVKLSKGVGSFFEASERIETLPSLLPNGTSHVGPFIWKTHNVCTYVQIKTTIKMLINVYYLL